MNAFFITGTDTDIGKTYAMCDMIRTCRHEHQSVLALKPVASGCIKRNEHWVSEDVIAYEKILKEPAILTPWAFEPPIAPHLAANLVDVQLDANDIVTWCLNAIRTNLTDVVLIEGAGGVLVPLNAHQTWIDVIQLLKIPVIIVVGLRLGCINHALLTETVLLANQCNVAGWIANELGENNTAEMKSTLMQWMKSPCLKHIHYRKISKSQGAC